MGHAQPHQQKLRQTEQKALDRTSWTRQKNSSDVIRDGRRMANPTGHVIDRLHRASTHDGIVKPDFFGDKNHAQIKAWFSTSS